MTAGPFQIEIGVYTALFMHLIQCISWPSHADLEIKTGRSVLSARFCVLLLSQASREPTSSPGRFSLALRWAGKSPGDEVGRERGGG